MHKKQCTGKIWILTSIGWASLEPDRSHRSCDMCLQNFKSRSPDDRQKMIHSPETEFHLPSTSHIYRLGFSRTRQISQILWHVLAKFQAFRWQTKDHSFAWDWVSLIPRRWALWMCPLSNSSPLFANPQTCGDFLTLLAAWEISRISVRNRFELDVCYVRKYRYLNPLTFPPFFEYNAAHGIMGYNLTHKSMRQSGSLVTRLSNVGRSRILSRSVVFHSRFLCGNLFGHSAYFCIFFQMKYFYKNGRISKFI